MTTGQVMQLRQQKGWVSPEPPVEPGELRFLWNDPSMTEVLAHVDDAMRYLVFGIVVDGATYKCRAVDVHPLLNAIQLRVRTDEVMAAPLRLVA